MVGTVFSFGIAHAKVASPITRYFIDFQPSEWEFGDTFLAARQTLKGEGFSTIEYRQGEPSYSPAASLEAFRSCFDQMPEVFLHASHGMGENEIPFMGGISIESFPHDHYGRLMAESRAISYGRSLFPADDSVYLYVADPMGASWNIMLTERGLARVASSSPELAFVSSCYGLSTAAGWGAKSVVTYRGLVENKVAVEEARVFWMKMKASRGLRPTAGRACTGTQLTIQGTADLVLSEE